MAAGKIRTLEKARASGLLTDADVEIVDRSLVHYRSEYAVEALRESFVNRKRARRLAGKVAVARDVRLQDRIEAVAAVVAPGLAARVHRRRAGRFWVGAGGVRVEREQAARVASVPSGRGQPP
jgi:hypothetical protein